jgi:hypothetical protein
VTPSTLKKRPCVFGKPVWIEAAAEEVVLDFIEDMGELVVLMVVLVVTATESMDLDVEVDVEVAVPDGISSKGPTMWQFHTWDALEVVWII